MDEKKSYEDRVEAAVLSGSLTLDADEVGQIDDHFSFMHHFRSEVLSKWLSAPGEYWDMISQHLADLGPRPPDTDEYGRVI